MKRALITILVLAGFGTVIYFVLQKNKRENEAKTAVVAQQANATVVVTAMTVAEQPLNLDFSVNGIFTANQDLKLMAEASGRVTQILVKEGSRVSKGQVLAKIDAEYANLDVQRIQDALAKLKTDHARYKSSYETGGVTKAQLDEVELSLRNTENQLLQANRKLSDATVKSPISGVINQRLIEVGAYVGPATELFEIVDVSRLKLEVSVNESQVVQLKEGDRVKISSSTFPDQEFDGTVRFIAVKADNSLNYPLEIEVANNAKSQLKAGMYGNANFKFPNQDLAILVPRSAFIGSVGSNQVFVLQSDSTAVKRQVVSGRIIGDQVLVLQGLEVGETVITSGQINLNEGVKVEVQGKN